MQSKVQTVVVYALMMLRETLKKRKFNTHLNNTEVKNRIFHTVSISLLTKPPTMHRLLNTKPENPKHLTLPYIRAQIRKNFFQAIHALKQFGKFAL